MPDPTAALAEFVTYVGTHLTGDEKGEAADFLDHLFRALGHAGVKEAGASREVRVAKKGFGSKGKNYIDLLWPERVLMEMKSRGKKLERHYDQIFDYWTHIVPHHPPYVILCNFDEFWIYDFNQQLFDPIELTPAEISTLAEAADFDWSMVKPEIFGTLFQSSMDADERHAFGAHFTSEFDIRKVVGPTIVRQWRERMKAAWDIVGDAGVTPEKKKRAKKEGLKEVLRDLRLFRVLDPACGSGNFLYVAYREMKRLEREILLRLSEISKGEPLETAVSIHQFHGIDIQPFAVELAKVTLMLAKEQEVREAAKLMDSDGLLVLEKPLPLDNLDKNILCADALFIQHDVRMERSSASRIVLAFAGA